MAKKWDDDYLHVLICHLMEFTQMHQHFQQAWIIYTLYSHLIRSSSMQIELFFPKNIFSFSFHFTQRYIYVWVGMMMAFFTHRMPIYRSLAQSLHISIYFMWFFHLLFFEWCNKIIRFLFRNSFLMNSNDNKQRMHLITTDNKLCQWVRSFDSIFILDIRIVHSALTA